MSHKLIITLYSLVISGYPVWPQVVGVKGQFSAWVTTKPKETFRTQIGGRYIPELNIDASRKDKYTMDAEISLNLYGYGEFRYSDTTQWGGDLNPYRVWIRFATSRLEIRGGLQKISFGSASMLRPMMWFDQIDPRDPLQITNGVYGLLGRYYFKNNANIWFWVLYGNDQPKGWEFIPSSANKPEAGGRIQFPVLKGELAGSYHYRTANPAGVTIPGLIPDSLDYPVPENRIGFDGRWDPGFGIWFETSFIFQETDVPGLRYTQLVNLGLDYTFGIGNGLTVMSEQFWYTGSSEFFGEGSALSFTALSLNYPLNLIDNLSGIFYYDWKNHSLYNFINWGMRWDKISLYFMGFWNPKIFQIYNSANNDLSLYAGKGLLIQFVFNH